MNEEIKTILEKIGLNPTESDLYVKSLELGPASAIELGKEVGISRQMVYQVTSDLIAKGLVKEITIGKKRYFASVSPEVLVDIAERTKQQVSDLVPVLKSRLSYEKAIPEVTIYDNPLAMREWYRKVLSEARKGDEMLIWSSGKNWFQLDAEFYQKYLDRKIKMGIVEKVLKPDKPELREQYADMQRKNAEWKFYDGGWNENTEKIVWRDEVSLLTIKGNFTNLIVIKSADLAQLERFDFERIWNSLK